MQIGFVQQPVHFFFPELGIIRDPVKGTVTGIKRLAADTGPELVPGDMVYRIHHKMNMKSFCRGIACYISNVFFMVTVMDPKHAGMAGVEIYMGTVIGIIENEVFISDQELFFRFRKGHKLMNDLRPNITVCPAMELDIFKVLDTVIRR